MRCLLSIDAGGTKCQTVAVNEDGDLVGWGRSGFPDAVESANVHGGSGRSIESIAGAITQALHGVECDELHVVGGYRQRSLDALIATRYEGGVTYHPCHEWEGILDLVELDHGVIASAGTGAFVHVTGKDQSHIHLDSLGPILGDWGSAYHVGMLAVQAVAKYDWHPRHQTSLKEAVYRGLGIEETSGRGTSLIFVFERVKDRAQIADLARIVNDEARRGDEVAVAILREAAASLAQTVYDAYDGLNLNGAGYSLVGTGGVIERSDIYWECLCNLVREFAPDLVTVRTDLPHVVGTALSALHTIANGDLDAARARLICGAREVFSNNSGGDCK